MISSPIADMICRIKMACHSGKREVMCFSSKIKVAIAKILEEEGYIHRFEVLMDGAHPILKIYLKYKSGIPVIFDIKIISKPGYRVYRQSSKLPIVLNGMGTSVISTNQGIMCEKVAKKLGLGGEVILNIW